MTRRPPWFAIILALVLLAARVLRVAPLTNPAGQPLPSGLHLDFPIVHLLLIPLFDLWDAVSLLSLDRLKWFAGGVLTLYVVWRIVAAWRRHRNDPDAGPPIGLLREVGTALAALLLFGAFLAGGLLWHRPMVAPAGVPSEFMVVDFHAHSNVSHDVRDGPFRGFDAEASRRWHRRAGFDAFYLTDHNTVAGLPPPGAGGSPAVCPGIEISAWRLHLVLLGTRDSIGRPPASDSLRGITRFLAADPARGTIRIASLPEYDRNHWPNLDALVEAGVDGFEIVNGSPKARTFTLERRDSIIALARARGLLLLAVTDSHGWGATVPAWNLVPVPGWREAPDPCTPLQRVLAQGDAATVTIAERHHLRDQSAWPGFLTPVAVVWESWRAAQPLQTIAWLAWIWTVGILLARSRPGESA